MSGTGDADTPAGGSVCIRCKATKTRSATDRRMTHSVPGRREWKPAHLKVAHQPTTSGGRHVVDPIQEIPAGRARVVNGAPQAGDVDFDPRVTRAAGSHSRKAGPVEAMGVEAAAEQRGLVDADAGELGSGSVVVVLVGFGQGRAISLVDS